MHSIDPANTRSQALAKRLGATNSGPTRLPAPFEDAPVDAWTQSADAWRSTRGDFRPCARRCAKTSRSATVFGQQTPAINAFSLSLFHQDRAFRDKIKIGRASFRESVCTYV